MLYFLFDLNVHYIIIIILSTTHIKEERKKVYSFRSLYVRDISVLCYWYFASAVNNFENKMITDWTFIANNNKKAQIIFC